jgi:hypothetical protein
MTDEEIEVVAEELAKLISVPWPPGHEMAPLMRVVTDCHRAEARAIIAALNRIRRGRSHPSSQTPPSDEPQRVTCQNLSGDVRPGMTVISARTHAGSWKSKGIVPTWLLYSGPASAGFPSKDFRSRSRTRSRTPKSPGPELAGEGSTMKIAVGDEVRVHYHPPGPRQSFVEGVVSRVEVSTLRGRVFVVDATHEVVLDREQPIQNGYQNYVVWLRNGAPRSGSLNRWGWGNLLHRAHVCLRSRPASASELPIAIRL